MLANTSKKVELSTSTRSPARPLSNLSVIVDTTVMLKQQAGVTPKQNEKVWQLHPPRQARACPNNQAPSNRNPSPQITSPLVNNAGALCRQPSAAIRSPCRRCHPARANLDFHAGSFGVQVGLGLACVVGVFGVCRARLPGSPGWAGFPGPWLFRGRWDGSVCGSGEGGADAVPGGRDRSGPTPGGVDA
jgi:hypothetical protein